MSYCGLGDVTALPGELFGMSQPNGQWQPGIQAVWSRVNANPTGPFAPYVIDPRAETGRLIGSSWSDENQPGTPSEVNALSALYMLLPLPSNWTQPGGKIPVEEMMTMVLGMRALYRYATKGTDVTFPPEPLEALRTLMNAYAALGVIDTPPFRGSFTNVPASVTSNGQISRFFSPIPWSQFEAYRAARTTPDGILGGIARAGLTLMPNFIIHGEITPIWSTQKKIVAAVAVGLVGMGTFLWWRGR